MNQFNIQIQKLIKEDNVCGAEKILEEQLKKYPKDIELWLKLCMTRMHYPIADGEKALLCIDEIYKIDVNNFYATIFECCIYNQFFGEIQENQYNKLLNLKNCNNEQLSIAKFLMAFYWRYTKKDIERTIEVLKESIDLDNKSVSNYNYLSLIYLNNGNEELALQLRKKAVDNIQMIYPKNYIYDFTDVNEYINEFLRGIYATEERVETILDGHL